MDGKRCSCGADGCEVAIAVSGYLPIITLTLVCQDETSDDQRISRLRAELAKFYGRPVEFHDFTKETINFNLIPEQSDEELWEIERFELRITRVPQLAISFNLHRSLRITSTYGILPSFEQFLVHLINERIVDFVRYVADRQIRTLYFFSANRPIHLYLGTRAAIYLLLRRLCSKKRAREHHAKGRGYMELLNIVAGHIANEVVTIPAAKRKYFIKTIDDELRLKLGTAQFNCLIAELM